jgi:Serine/threonine protein phosphatase
MQVLSFDHKTTNQREVKRVLAAGGSISSHTSTPRLFGISSVTRSIGDKKLKSKMAGVLIAEPQISILNVRSEKGMIILASNGVWDVLGNNDVEEITKSMILPGPGNLAEKIIEKVMQKRSHDDSTIIAVKINYKVF